MSDTSDLTTRFDFAVRAARRAGEIAMAHFQTGVAVERKHDQSPVTIADRQAEQELRDMISRQFPGDGILGEEFGETAGTSDWRWILDPIDGTESFIRGVPLFGVLIGAELNGDPVLGVAFMPALGEVVCAAQGLGCFWQPAGSSSMQHAYVSTVSHLKDAMILTTSIDYWAQTGRAEQYQRVAAAGRTRGWSDCYAHILVATGRADVAIEPVMSVWDSAPFLPILEEAGGTYTDWNGNRTIWATDTFSSNGKLFKEVWQLLG